jgi:hypothetical protein
MVQSNYRFSIITDSLTVTKKILILKVLILPLLNAFKNDSVSAEKLVDEFAEIPKMIIIK